MDEQILRQIQAITNEKSIIITADSSFVDIIDSITFIKIVIALEKTFNFEFDDEMLLLTAFPTIKSMIKYVESKVS